jgi:polyhydroxyalkanoate synthase subunit PhaC
MAAIFAASAPERLRGLVMLAAPLCFEGGVSAFRDAFVALAPRAPSEGLVPGSLLSTLSVMAAPATFLGSLPLNAAFSMFDFRAATVHARVQRWLLDEAPVSATLSNDVLERLFKENQFCRGELCLGRAAIGPSTMQLPTLAVASPDDVIAPPETIQPFLDRMTAGRVEHILLYRSEIGAGLPHFAILVGRSALAEVWPKIFRWMDELV